MWAPLLANLNYQHQRSVNASVVAKVFYSIAPQTFFTHSVLNPEATLKNSFLFETLHIQMYIHTYIYMYVYVYVYIHIYNVNQTHQLNNILSLLVQQYFDYVKHDLIKISNSFVIK